MKIRYFKVFSEISQGSIIREQFSGSQAKTRGIALTLCNTYIYMYIFAYIYTFSFLLAIA